MTPPKYERLVRNMGERPDLGGADVEYAAEIVTGGEAGVPDTVIIVTDEAIVAGPIEGKKDASEFEFTLPLDHIEQIECEGMFAGSIPITANPGTYTIPTEGLDPIRFTSTVVEHTSLVNDCERLGFGRTRFRVCKWSTCLGAAMILVGIGFSVTMIGILVGIPFIGLGSALLLFALGYKKAGDHIHDSIWSLPDAEPEPA